jgi:hypothetical protein
LQKPSLGKRECRMRQASPNTPSCPTTVLNISTSVVSLHMLLHRTISYQCAGGHRAAASVHLCRLADLGKRSEIHMYVSSPQSPRGETTTTSGAWLGRCQYCEFREETEYKMTITWVSLRVYVGCEVDLVHIPPQHYSLVCQRRRSCGTLVYFMSPAGWQDGCRHLHRSVM